MKAIHRLACAAAAIALLGACKRDEPAPLYEPTPVERRDIVVSAEAAGTVEPILVVDVKSKASGEILELRGETGDIVNQGELLVRVDPRDPNNSVAQAEADLDVARAQFSNAEAQKRRADQMFESQLMSEQEHESAILTYANARAQQVRAERALESARDQLDDTNVRAPITGTIIQKNVERGQVITSATREVSGGTVLLRMADLNEVQVRTLVDETDIGKIQAGMRATITVDAYPNRPFEGSVLKIEPQSTTNQNVTMFPVLIRIPNEQGLLRPGMNASVEVHIANRTNVLAIPNAALRTQRDVESAAQVLGLEMADIEATLARADSQARNAPPTPGGQRAPGAAPGSDRAAATRAAPAVAAVPPQNRPGQGTDVRAAGPGIQAPGGSMPAGQGAGGDPSGAVRPGGFGGPGGPGMGLQLPPGVTQEMMAEIRRKRQAGEPLTPAESTASARVREQFQRMREQAGTAGGGPGQSGAVGGAPAQPGAAAPGEGGAAPQMQLPPGVTQEQARDIMRRRLSGGTLTAREQTIAAQLTRSLQQAGGGANSQRRRFGSGSSFQFGGSYIVFVLDSGRPTPRRIRTGYTDMDYSEVVSGLTERDTVVILPSASLINQQTQMRNRMSQMGGAMPGMRQGGAGGPGGGGPPPGGPPR